jgi:hypothetical protein
MEKFLIEIPPTSSPTINHQKTSALLFISETFLMVTIFFVFSVLLVPVSSFLYKNRRYLFNFKSRKKAICHQCNTCHYFKSNPYLKCSIHPMTVLTEEAIECTDYVPCQKTKRF